MTHLRNQTVGPTFFFKTYMIQQGKLLLVLELFIGLSSRSARSTPRRAW
jgi:hypothetical protein